MGGWFNLAGEDAVSGFTVSAGFELPADFKMGEFLFIRLPWIRESK